MTNLKTLYTNDRAFDGIYRACIVCQDEGDDTNSYRVYIPAVHRNLMPFSGLSDNGVIDPSKGLNGEETQQPDSTSQSPNKSESTADTANTDSNQNSNESSSNTTSNSNSSDSEVKTDEEANANNTTPSTPDTSMSTATTSIKEIKIANTTLSINMYPKAPTCYPHVGIPLKIGDAVWVTFEGGDAKYPVIVGQLGGSLEQGDMASVYGSGSGSGGSSNGSGFIAGTGGSDIPDNIRQATKEEKMNWLFPNGKPQSTEQARQYLATAKITILTKSGQPSDRTLDIHKALVGDVEAIFKEIKDAGFCAYDVGSFRNWEPLGSGSISQHSYGLAIDINPNENYMIRRGSIVCGKCWNPGSNKYSMPADGPCVKAFRARGWDWGGLWNSCKDYMHFSFGGG